MGIASGRSERLTKELAFFIVHRVIYIKSTYNIMYLQVIHFINSFLTTYPQKLCTTIVYVISGFVKMYPHFE